MGGGGWGFCGFLPLTVLKGTHLVVGHTLLGELVEVCPHGVPQEDDALLRQVFKHL